MTSDEIEKAMRLREAAEKIRSEFVAARIRGAEEREAARRALQAVGETLSALVHEATAGPIREQ